MLTILYKARFVSILYGLNFILLTSPSKIAPYGGEKFEKHLENLSSIFVY